MNDYFNDPIGKVISDSPADGCRLNDLWSRTDNC